MASPRDSSASALIHKHLDSATDGEDASLDASGDGSALDALWRFEAAHHFLLNQPLAAAHSAFVDDLYAALEAARDALEQQSMCVLSVLHDKDVRIQQLEQNARKRPETCDSSVQTAARQRRHQATQCSLDASIHAKVLENRIEEQQEQIDVLLDELERVQRARSDAESAPKYGDPQQNPDHHEEEQEASRVAVETAATATQTERLDDHDAARAERTLSAPAVLQTQLEAVDTRNQELQVLVAKKHQETETELDMNAVERQLSEAIHVMELSSSQCRALSPLVAQGGSRSCLDLEHHLQLAHVERAHLKHELLALRKTTITHGAWTNIALLDESKAAQDEGCGCSQITCPRVLGAVLEQLRAMKSSHRDAKTTTLRAELRRALRGCSAEQAALVVAQVGAGWMQWETCHVEEVEVLQRSHQEELQAQSARCKNLVDEIYRLNQTNTELQVQLKARVLDAEQRISPAQPHPKSATVSAVDTDRRALVLEQTILLKDEQLDIANRAVIALSSENGSQLREVRFADKERANGQKSVKAHIAQLNAELQAMQEAEFKRLLPSGTSQQAVVDYFRLEKECLRFRCRINDKEERIQQLELHCQQLEQSSAALLTKCHAQVVFDAVEKIINSDTGERSCGTQAYAGRYYQRFLECQNQELWLELQKGLSRVARLEKELETALHSHHTASEDAHSSHFLREVVHKVEEYHAQAHAALQTWRRSVHDASIATSTVQQARPHPAQVARDSYGILLDHYETLGAQLRLLEDASSSVPVASCAREHPFGGLSRDLQLLRKVHALEDCLLEAQFCKTCQTELPKRKAVKTIHSSMTTESAAVVEASTQVNARDQRRFRASKGVQAEITLPQASPQSKDGMAEITARMASEAERAAAKDCDDPQPSVRLDAIQHQLEASLARIDELAAQKQKLKVRLDESRKTNRQHVHEQAILRTQVAEASSSNASLTSQLQQYKQALAQSQTSEREQEYDASIPKQRELESESVQKKLTVRDQENQELVRQLCQVKERCFQIERHREDAERKVKQLEAALETQQASRSQEQNQHLEQYMAKVNQSLASIERDKERLARENRELQHKVQRIEMEAAIKDARGTRACGTETDEYVEVDRLRQLPEYQSLETQVVMLRNELESEHHACETLRAAQKSYEVERAQTADSQKTALENEKMALVTLAAEIKIAHESLQKEFADLQAASIEAREQADKRIAFLTACVEECTRLVDTSGPTDEVVTARDIYDTIVTLSQRVALSPGLRTKSHPTKSKSTPIRSQDASTPRANLHDAGFGAAQLHSQLQAETWRLRVAKLESSLRAVTLQNKTFEDMMDRLELQMEGLTTEVKDRMTKEAVLLSKQGQLKVEITNLKAQHGTLTSRLAEACGELKRTQDVSKGIEAEMARLRSALQRKTELLTRQKTKCEDTQRALNTSFKRITQLEVAEKTLAGTLLKHKDQAQQVHDLRQQWGFSRDANIELKHQLDKKQEQLAELQSRSKVLRRDNRQLRDQVKQLRQTIRDDAETNFTARASDVAVAAASLGDGKLVGNLTVTAAVDVLGTQVKTLKRRVLQKQDVISAYKTKIAELDAELTLQRTRLFDLSQAHRQATQIQREKEQSMLQGVTHLKEELEASVSTKAEQLDGLRASVFDACEVFVKCLPSPPAVSPSSHSSPSLSWPEETELDGESSGTTTDALLLELRHYADLSPDDLTDLRITRSSRQTASNKASARRNGREQRDDRFDCEHRLQLRHKQGQRILHELEHALEVTPQDCRIEICQVLEFLSQGRIQNTHPARRC